MYITNPTVMGVFGYSWDDSVGELNSFMESQPDFLKEYALSQDIPFIVFGD